jgi:hypothetical protein
MEYIVEDICKIQFYLSVKNLSSWSKIYDLLQNGSPDYFNPLKRSGYYMYNLL